MKSPTHVRARGWLLLVVLAVIAAATVAFIRTREWTASAASARTSTLPARANRLPAPFRAAWAAAVERGDVAQQGRLAHANGFFGVAGEMWRKLSERDSGNAQWPHLWADALRQDGRESEAVSQWELTVERAPEYAPAWLKLGDAYFKTGDRARARLAYARRVELLPDDPFASLGLARLIEDEETDSTRTALEQLVQRHPKFSPAHTLLADAFQRAGDEEQAAAHRWLAAAGERFREAPDPWVEDLLEHCFDAERLTLAGAVAVELRDWPKAEQRLLRAVELAPERSEAHELLGRVYTAQQRLDEATAILERGVGLSDATAAMWAELSDAQARSGDLARATQSAREGLERWVGHSRLHQALGEALSRAGDPAAAEREHQAAFTADPRSIEPGLSLATLRLRAGDQAGAIAWLEQALARHSAHPKTVMMLANLEMDQGRMERPGLLLKRVFAAYRGMPEIRQALARWYLQSAIAAAQAGEVARAEELAMTGRTQVPEAAPLRGFLGYVYAQTRRLPEAAAELEAARELQPDEARVVITLVQVYAQLGRMAEARRAVTAAREYCLERGNTELAGQFAELLQQLPQP